MSNDLWSTLTTKQQDFNALLSNYYHQHGLFVSSADVDVLDQLGKQKV